MMADLREHINKFCFCVIFLINLISCTTSDEGPYKKGLSYLKSNNFKSAIESFKESVLINKKGKYAFLASKEGAHISYYELKDYESALFFLKNIIISSPIYDERLQAQKQIATINFTHLNDYKNSVIEINRLLTMMNEKTQIEKLKQDLAKSYFYLNNFIQAESEVNDILNNTKSAEIIFEMLVLKGNIFLAKKDLQQASVVFQEILKKYPEKATQANIATTLAVAYEEMKDYKNAITVLESMKQYHPTPEYIELRIKRLKQSEKNQPGAKGIRKK